MAETALETSSYNPFRILVDQPNFRLFWIGQTVSLVGTWMQSMAQGWLALELSGSASFVGLVACAGSLPILLLSLHAGVLVDRVDKLRLVQVAQLVLLVEAAFLTWFVWSGRITTGWLLAFAALNGLATAFEIPGRQSLVVDLAGRGNLHEAIALNSSGFNLARIVGPAVGALVIRWAGLAGCFAVNTASYLAVLVGLSLIRLPASARGGAAPSPHSAAHGVREGMRYVARTRTVRALMVTVAVSSVLGTPYLTLMPVFARDVLGTGAGGYGTLLTSVGIGGLAGALALASLSRRLPRGRLLMVATLAFAALLVLFALTRSLHVAQGVLLLTGFAMIVTGALSNSLLQQLVPDALRGRVMALYSLVVVGLPLTVGALVGGRLAAAVGVPWVVGGGGAVVLLFTAVMFARTPELARL
jgi:MFS family permease